MNIMSRYKKLFLYFTMFSLCVGLNACRSAGLSDHHVFQQSENLTPSTQGYAQSHQPRQIALLLPLSGQHADSAKAIREGFLASYYESGAQGPKPVVKVYDTTKENDIHRIYDLALNEGADFVVGPLSKEDVLRLSQLPSHALKTPVLALNHHPAIQSAPSNFTQFTLAPEAEAEQIADKAWQSGYRNASIIVPENAWGKRIANAFAQRWQAQGGRVIHTIYANPSQDQSAAVRNLLGIDQSQKRANQIKSLLSEKVEFQPRRRQDLDLIVMAAPPDQARQLKPLFDFYYAEDVPVYATSSIYSGHPNAKRDRDMNGVIFCDMPWLVDQGQGAQMKRLLKDNASGQSDQYHRLFAMGADAYQLATRLSTLQSNPNANFLGATGLLSLGPNNQVQRKLTFAKIADGVPKQMQ